MIKFSEDIKLSVEPKLFNYLIKKDKKGSCIKTGRDTFFYNIFNNYYINPFSFLSENIDLIPGGKSKLFFSPRKISQSDWINIIYDTFLVESEQQIMIFKQYIDNEVLKIKKILKFSSAEDIPLFSCEDLNKFKNFYQENPNHDLCQNIRFCLDWDLLRKILDKDK